MIKENFHIVNFPFLNSNIPAAPAYGVYIVRLGRICDDYYKFARRNHMVTSRLVKQGFRYDKLCGSFKKFTHNHATLFRKVGASVKQHIHDGIGLPICIVAALTKHVTCRRGGTMSTF